MFIQINFKFPMIRYLHNSLNKGFFCHSLTDYNFVLLNPDDYIGHCIGFVESSLYEFDEFDIIANFEEQNLIFVWSLFESEKRYQGVNVYKSNKVLVPKQIFEDVNFMFGTSNKNVVKYYQ